MTLPADMNVTEDERMIMAELRSATRLLVRVSCAFMLTLAVLIVPGVVHGDNNRYASAASVPPSVPVDGKSELTAAASCWEIKQNDPSARNGIYWLATPAMGGAERFYCDQETSGGGWVLVGRGREAWSVANIGSGTPAQVRENVTGKAAFTPRQLSSEIIEQLVNRQPIDSLPDGIRLVRARNSAGTQWHELTFTFASPRSTWSWQFSNDQRIKNYTIGSRTYSGGYTQNFGQGNDYDRVRMTTGAYEGWHMGFGYGANVRGANNADTFIWSKDSNTGYARPFTQVYLRPQLLSTEVYEPIAEEGLQAVSGPEVVDSFSLRQAWGVAGLGAGPATVEGSNEVSAFTESEDRVFVGGNFTRVQRSGGGSGAQQQAYLAAFDRDSGEWDPDFRPTFNNQIKALASLPGDRIAAGGYFTQVNGENREGLVVLDGKTGEIDPDFTGKLRNYLSGGVPVVRTLSVHNGWLYAAGSFTHSTGGAEEREVYTRAAARFKVEDGTADQTWNPEFNGTVMSVDASNRGDRVYFAGFFSQSKGRTAEKAAALAADSEDLIPWEPLFSNRSGGRTGYQQAVKEVGDRVWLGGSEHSLFSYSRDDFSVLSTTIGNNGGDFQAIATDGNAVYGGCHCFETQYEGANKWPSVGQSWTEANAIYGTGAWSAESGMAIPSFNGTFTTRAGAGAWALFVDSAGTLWQGGDWTSSTLPGYQKQWSGGFIRHAQRDTTPPTVPREFSADANSQGVELSWSASDDDAGVVAYEVLRTDRVVATVAETAVTLPPGPEGSLYFVRAIDSQGNKSASTAGIAASEIPEPPDTEEIITAGSEWTYMYSGTAPEGDWNAPLYDDGSWDIGTAPFGWGHANLGTILESDAPKPVVSIYRHEFEIEADSTVENIELTTRADDGIVLYVNGSEVKRVNIDEGTIHLGAYPTYANSAVTASSALANPVKVTVPRELLRPGNNVIAASVHSNYRSTASHSFELVATATHGEVEPFPDPPAEPQTKEFIQEGANWTYLYSDIGPEEGWTEAGFNDEEWEKGLAPLGWGHSNLGTVLLPDTPRPVVSVYRHEFEIEAGTELEEITLTTRADDGIVLYVNGQEIERVNIDEGIVRLGSYPTYANRAIGASYAVSNPVVITVPADAFVAGTNVISASVHSNYRSTPSHSFELTAVAIIGGEPVTAASTKAPEPEHSEVVITNDSEAPSHDSSESSDPAATKEHEPRESVLREDKPTDQAPGERNAADGRPPEDSVSETVPRKTAESEGAE